MDQPSTSTHEHAPANHPVTTYGTFRSEGQLQSGAGRPVGLQIATDDLEQPSVPFSRVLRNFTIVPVLSLLEFAITAAVLLLVPTDSTPHLPNVLAFAIALAFWSLSHHIGPPLFRLLDALTESVSSPGALSETILEVCSTLIHVALKELARLTAVIILYQTGHPDLIDVLWLALGWAAGEVTCGITQNYLNLNHYRSALFVPDDSAASKAPWRASEEIESATGPSTEGPNHMVLYGEVGYDALLERELSSLAALKARLELDGIYGVSFPDIPPIIVAIQWLDSLLLSLGLTLIISHAYIVHGYVQWTLPTVAINWAVHSCLALLYAIAMPRIGVHAVNYFGLIIGIGCLVTGLTQWGVLE